MEKTDNERLAASVLVKVTDCEPEGAVRPETAKHAFEIAKAVNHDRRFFVAIDGSAFGSSDKCGDRGRHAGDGVDTAWDFFDVNAGIGKCSGHDFPFLSDGLAS